MEFVREVLGQLTAPAHVAGAVRTLVSVALIVAAAAAAVSLSRRVLDRLLRPLPGVRDYEARLARARTLASLAHSVVRYTVYFVALVMILRQVNVDAAAVIASAGIAGLAVGLGAQTLVRDSLSGFFLLLDGSLQVGDVVSVAGEVGQVEQITLRNTQIRRYTGELVTIPNGEITRFANLSRGYLRAVVLVTLPADADLAAAAAVAREVAENWASQQGDQVTGPVELDPLVELSSAGATLRVAVPVLPAFRAEAERQLRWRLREALREAGLVVQALSGSPWPL
ncbi:MAG: mechanosensitive ion channel [Armatimonadota bacterium]|nr:mechanosensitive ion channel family protein [Armatimonadota bacterium]MDW8156661.1 mechanosensitive ion channel [Armatimonadota bacterium]